MNKVTDLHRRAMSLLDEATSARKSKNLSIASAQLRAAFDLEVEAADMLRSATNSEPSRSVLYRSAASLAIQCGLYADAEILIYRGLSGEPPVAIRLELQELLESATFGRHLALRGVELSNIELQVVLDGNGIGPGIAPTSAVVQRVEGTNLLLYRTAERLADRGYREAGRPTNEIRDVSESFMGLPRAASYAFSLKVGRLQQMSFNDPSEGLVDELLDCLEMVDNGNQAGLRDRISDPAYYNNFVALAQNILPDGETVKTVGFTVRRSQGLRQVALRHTATEVREGFKPIVASNAQRISRGKERPVVVTGQLRFADSVHETNRIQVVPETGNAVTVYVPEGMMSDIVRPLWDEWVTIDGLKMGRTITLINIYKAV